MLLIFCSNKDCVVVVGFVFCGMWLGSSFGEMLMLYDYLIYNCIFIVEEFIYVLFVDEVLYIRFFGVYKLEWEKKMSFVN